MTTPSDPTNTPDNTTHDTPHDLVPHLVPDLVPKAVRAPSETTSSPVPSSSIGDEVSEPARPRPTTSSRSLLEELLEPHDPEVLAATPWAERLEAIRRRHRILPARGASEDLDAVLEAYDGLVVQLGEVRANRDRLAHEVARQRAALERVRALYGGEPPPLFLSDRPNKVLRVSARRDDLCATVTESVIRVRDIRAALDGAHPTPSDGSGTNA